MSSSACGGFFQIPGGVTAAAGFQAAGMYGGLRAAGRKPDLALVVCDTDAVSAGGWVLFSSYQVLALKQSTQSFHPKNICSLLAYPTHLRLLVLLFSVTVVVVQSLAERGHLWQQIQ